MKYIKGNYYKGLGTYLEIRKTYTPNKKMKVEHIFDTGGRDIWGVAQLKRIGLDG